MSGSFNALQITDPSASDNPLTAGTPSLGEAAYTSISKLDQWMAAQRAKSQHMGLWTGGSVFQGGHPTAAGMADIGGQYANALLMGTTAPGGKGITAYHGSPYSFEKFDTSKIGTGEGAQAYGHGLYFAGNEGVAKSYRDALSGGMSPEDAAAHSAALNQAMDIQEELGNLSGPRTFKHDSLEADRDTLLAKAQDIMMNAPRNPGSMYEVNIGADPEQFLHWDKPLSAQSDAVKAAIANLPFEGEGGALRARIYSGQKGPANAEQAQILRDAGIPGIRYLDQGSRGSGEGTHNYVVFDANTIDILRKYGIAGLGLGLSAAAATDGSQQPPMAQ